MKKKAAPLVGAKIMYCGHDGWFIADIIHVGNCAVVRGGHEGPRFHGIDAGNLIRGRNEEATHHISDFPGPVFWAPGRAIFVVPRKNLKELER